jgi:hypothetical protein
MSLWGQPQAAKRELTVPTTAMAVRAAGREGR